MSAHDRLERAYRALLVLYPRAFRERFGAELADVVRDQVRAARRGEDRRGVAVTWVRAFADLALSAAAERARRPARPRVSEPDPFPGESPGAVMQTLVHDLRHAWRGMLARPALSLVIVLTLAAGIGANTAIFSVVHGVLLRALPFDEPGRIVRVNLGDEGGTISEPEFVDLRDGMKSFSRVAAFQGDEANLTGDGEPERVELARVSDGFFSAIGVAPQVGRTFTPDEDRRGQPRVAMISDGFWRRRFGGDPRVIGSEVQLNGDPVTIIGVLPAGLDYPSRETAMWLPLRLNYDSLWTRNNHYLGIVARLAPTATLEGLRAELATMVARWKQDFPESYPKEMVMRGVVTPIADSVLGRTRPYLWSLLGAVVLVLAIACVNVANLLLARGEARRREMAIRSALGASRGRIVRQALTESTVYAIAGAGLGLPLAWWGVLALRALGPADIPRLDAVQVDVPVLLVTLGTALATGFLFGLAPALRASREDPGETLKDGGRSGGGGRGMRGTRRALVIGEVALAVVALTGAGLMLRSLARLQSVELGFRPEGVLTVKVPASSRQYGGPRAAELWRTITTRAAAIPGARAVSAVRDLPLADGYSAWSIVLDGQRFTTIADAAVATPEQVTPGYFSLMGIPLRRGRVLTADDRTDAPKVVVVNEALAQKYWPGRDPLGHTIRLLADSAPWMTIVGVVGDVRHGGYQEEAPPTMYIPHEQAGITAYYWPPSMSLLLRTDGDPSSLVPAVRRLLREIDPALPLARVATMESLVSASVASRRFATQLLAGFAALALFLAAIGIYGVIAWGVTQRRFELGLRMALGATGPRVARLILGEGLALTAAGLVLGVAGGMVVLRLARAMLVDVSVADPLTLGVVVSLLVLVALLASWLPARRATRVDPTVALREG